MTKKTRKRILLVSSNSSGRGGGEKYLIYLAAGLFECGCEVHALLSNVAFMDTWAKELAHCGVTVHRRPLIPLSARRLRFVAAMLDAKQSGAIAAFCRELAPDGVVVNQQYDEDGIDYIKGVIQVQAQHFCGVMHMPMTREKNRRFLGWFRGRLLRLWFGRYAYPLILVSEGAQQEFESYYGRILPTFVVNNAIPIKSEAKELRREIWDDDVPVVGFVGQFVPQKNLLFLVAGWLAALKAGRNSRLLLVGDGPQRPAIERFLWNHAPPGSWFISGWTHEPDRLLANIDLFLLVSLFEGLPLSLLEFVAQGKPALVANFNGAQDVIRHAPWVRLTSNENIDRYVADMSAAIEGIVGGARPSSEDVAEYKRHFSLSRMARETLQVMGLP